MFPTTWQQLEKEYQEKFGSDEPKSSKCLAMSEKLQDLITAAQLDLKELQDQYREAKRKKEEYPAFTGVTTLQWHEWTDAKKFLDSEVDRLALEVRRKEEQITGLQRQRQIDLFPTCKKT